jgi:hypothetical protein
MMLSVEPRTMIVDIALSSRSENSMLSRSLLINTHTMPISAFAYL